MDTSHNNVLAWISAFALTKKGIFQALVRPIAGTTMAMGVESDAFKDCDSNLFGSHGWHLTREEAVAEAERMRQAEIARHKECIAKLEAIVF